MGPQSQKLYDLEERAAKFSGRVADYVFKLPKTIPNIEYSKQLVRSGGSIGANYIEANEGLGTKDFDLRIKILKKNLKRVGTGCASQGLCPSKKPKKLY